MDLVQVANDLISIPGAEHTPDPFSTAGRDNGVLFDDMVGFAVRQMSAAACGGVWNLTVVDDSKTQNSGGNAAALASLAMAVLGAVGAVVGARET